MERNFLLLSHLQMDGPHDHYIIFVLGQDKKYGPKYPLHEGVSEGKARGNSRRPRGIFNRIS